ncbi:sensor histidine kinase KdpD [uncultured Vagococcus sp.]|uniref:sensor histidine kinase KdpD n=1 Tax=uncultured Vagococcus sp. TaxID=189676 RepID=UPI0028D7A2AD|nr:sensor histidine kinase KdpD [uncultured Vagococcus sp.]
MKEEQRPNPDFLLMKYRENGQSRGSLKVFFGYAAGVGKTYSMLREAWEQKDRGRDVAVGYVEPHARPETLALLDGLEQLPAKVMSYRQMTLTEFDLDQSLVRQPELILVDELAHTNVTGSRNRKRYQDIQELLRAGIDVYTTMNVQHMESLNDIVESITGVHVSETVPDSFFEEALIKLIDVEPEELISRLTAGKIYQPENAKRAMAHFFTEENLSLLREIAIRKTADHIGLDNRPEAMPMKKKVQGKLLVYLEPQARGGFEKCLRWTARLATALRLDWVALAIQDEEADVVLQRQLNESFELAEKLGAETLTLNSDDPLSTLIHYAKITGISDIVIGKNQQKKWVRPIFRKELEDVLISELADVDIHIIPYLEKRPKQSLKEAKRNWQLKNWLSTGDLLKSGMLLVAGTLFSELFLYWGLGDQNVIIVYLFTVLVISRVTEGYVYGALSSIVSVLLFNWFFVEPLFSLTVYKAGYPITLIIMLSVALITSNMMIRVKKQAVESIEKEHRMEVIYELNQHLLGSENLADIVSLTTGYLGRMLEKTIIFYTEKPERSNANYDVQLYHAQDAERLTSEDERGVANWVFNNGKVAGFGSDTLMGANGYYLPIMSNGQVLGVIGILSKKESPLSHENHNFLKLITSQLSLALEGQQLADKQQRIMIENEKEKMRGNLLRAISHDLRTPLTGILGASSAMLENKGKLSAELEVQLLNDIKEDSEWLIRMVENLLSVTRIDEGTMRVKKVPEAVEEIVGAAVSRIRKRFKHQAIKVVAPSELLLVPMDGKLIEQVLINLLENGIKHSGTIEAIEVTVEGQGNEAVFTVSDHGSGLSEMTLEKLQNNFQGEPLIPVDNKRGLGIGLSICQTIVAAHGGILTGENDSQGGAVLRFSLPLREEG